MLTNKQVEELNKLFSPAVVAEIIAISEAKSKALESLAADYASFAMINHESQADLEKGHRHA